MDINSFWGEKATESEPLLVRVPRDAVLYVNQITLAGPCVNPTSLWVTSSYDSHYDPTETDEEDKESIEESSEDEDDLAVKTGPVAAGHLTWGRQESVRTKMVFGGGEKVKFTVEGDGEIHLIGHMSVEDWSMFNDDQYEDDEDDSDYDDYGHAVVLAGNGDRIHIGSDDEEEEDGEYEEVDSDDDDLEIDDEDEENSEDEVDEDGVIVAGPFIEEIDTDASEDDEDDDDEEERLDAREVRRLLLGEGAGDRPEDSDDDDDFDEDAFYRALARDDAHEDGEGADEMDIVDEAPSRKKRGRSGEFDQEFSSPSNGKKHKRHEHTNGNSRHQSHKHHGKKHHRGGRN